MKKKVLALLTALIMLLTTFSSISVFADTEVDRTAPVLKSITIPDGGNVTSKTERVNIQLDFIEEGTGLNEIYISFDDEDYNEYYWMGIVGGSYDEDAFYEDPVFTGTFTFDIYIHNHFAPGTYKIDYVRLVDFNGNSVTYSIEENPERFDENAKLVVTEQVLNPVQETAVVSDITVTPTENIDSDGTFTFKCTIDSIPDKYHMSFADFELIGPGSESGIYSFRVLFKGNKVTTGTYTTEIPIDGILPAGEYQMYSTSFNYEISPYEGDGRIEIYAEENPEIFTNRHFTVTKSKINTAPLVLTNVRTETKTLRAPAVYRLDMDFESNGNIPYWADLTFSTEYGKDIKFETLRLKGSGDHYYIEVPMSPFVAEGPLTLENIYIREKQYLSDTNAYDCNSYYRDEYDFFSNADIVLQTEYNITYFGSLGNSKALKNVKDLKTGETAVLDCRIKKTVPKEMFTAIAGKNVTLALIDDNVQWVFNGKDIKKSKCKDINVTSKIEIVNGANYGFSNDKKIALLKFRDNGELPGKVEMRINHEYLAVKYNFKKEDMKISYLDSGNAKLEDSNVDVAKDNYYEYEVDHNSTFALSKGKSKIGKVKFKNTSYNLSVIKISWKKTMGNGYYVYRSTSKNGPFKKVKTIKSRTKTSYIDYDVTTGKTYYYKVKPYSKNKTFNKTAKMSDVYKTTPRLGIPQMNSVKKVSGKTQVKVSWGTINWANANQKSCYNVYRSTSKNGTYKKIATVKSKTSYIDKKVTKGKTYYYKVKAVHLKKSSWSSPLSSYKSCKL